MSRWLYASNESDNLLKQFIDDKRSITLSNYDFIFDSVIDSKLISDYIDMCILNNYEVPSDVLLKFADIEQLNEYVDMCLKNNIIVDSKVLYKINDKDLINKYRTYIKEQLQKMKDEDL